MRGAVFVVVIAACGGGSSGPQPLVPDPEVQVGCVPRNPDQARAKVVACDDELVFGWLAAGRMGDFVLENNRVRVIVRGPGEGLYLAGMAGGGLIDAAPLNGEDHIKELQPTVDFAVGAYDELVITEAGDDGPAELVVRGPATGLDLISAALGREPPDVTIEHRYRLAFDSSVVELETRVFAPGGTGSHDLYEALFFGGYARGFVPGVGFDAGQVGAEIIATAGRSSSYGLVYPADAPLPQLIDLAGIRLAQGGTITGNGEPVRRWFVIGDGSVASVTETGWTLRGAALGKIQGTSAPGVDVVVTDPSGAPITVARCDDDAKFLVSVPPGSYTLYSDAPGERAPGARVAVTVVAGNTTLAGPVAIGARGTISVTVRDDTGLGIPARVMLEQDGLPERIEYIAGSGSGAFLVAPGNWRVSVSHGVEYDAVIADPVVVSADATVPVDVMLEHVVDTAGWISLDTHLHSELSTDSTFPLDQRLSAVLAEGVELPVSTDHDYITDYTPVGERTGITGIPSLNGEEASSLIWGHINAFPLEPDPNKVGFGAVRWHQRTPGEVFTGLRGGDPDRIVQVNHPRKDSNSLFDALDLDPVTLAVRADPSSLGLPPTADLSDLGFDAVEVVNTLSDDDTEEVFADWLAMVAAGHPAAATGSSDSHGASRFAGGARTYVWVGAGADDPTTIDPAAVVAGIRARHVVVATGAFVTAGIVTGATTSLPGDTVDVTGRPSVTLHVTVQAAPWQSLASIRIFEKTQQVRLITLDANDTAPVRYDADVTLPAPADDTFYVVVVDPAAEGAPVVTNLLPSFTNPVFASVQ